MPDQAVNTERGESEARAASEAAARARIPSAYTESEAKDEVIAAARALEDLGSCDKDECDCCDENDAVLADLRRSLGILDTYKGVK